jgi:hypothetical protein
MTGRAGVREADDIVKFYIALLDFFSSYFINEVHFWHYKNMSLCSALWFQHLFLFATETDDAILLKTKVAR